MNKKMASIFKMLSSTIDTEVLGAARAIGRMLKENGKDWNDLGAYIERWDAAPTKTYSVVAGAEPPRRHTTTNSVRPGWERRASETPVDHALVKEQVDELMNHLHNFSRKDLNFIESLGESFDLYGERTQISSAQQAWVQSLYTQYVENKGRRR